MSAIQEALNLREEPPAPAHQAEAASSTAPAADPFANIGAEVAAERPARRRPSRSAPPIDEDLFLQETVGRAPAPAAVEEVRPAQRAANDDRQSVGQILQSMQRRPSRAPYMAALEYFPSQIIPRGNGTPVTRPLTSLIGRPSRPPAISNSFTSLAAVVAATAPSTGA